MSLDHFSLKEHVPVHVHIEFDAVVLGHPNLKRSIYNALQSYLLLANRMSNFQVVVSGKWSTNVRPSYLHIVIDFDTWTTLNPKTFGATGSRGTKKGGQYWTSTNMGFVVQGRLNEIRSIQRRNHFKIETSGEWENRADKLYRRVLNC